MTSTSQHPQHAHSSHGPMSQHGEPDWDKIYAHKPEWDIDEPQPAFLALADSGAIRGPVLDVGCGTGEHVLMCADHRLEAVGIDISADAIHLAARKAYHRGLEARFRRHDIRQLGDLGEQFQTVLDCGLFVHIADSDADRTAFLGGLRTIVRPGGRYFMLCFRVDGPHHRAYTPAEITAVFTDGWRVDSIDPTIIHGRRQSHEIPAWLIALTRI